MSEVTARQLRDGASLIRRCGMFGLIGVLVFWGGQAALHALRTDLSVVNDYVSDYANGSWGPLFTVATLAHGVGNLAIAAGLGYALGSARAARAGVLLFTVAAFGLFVAAIFPTDPGDASQTVTGLVHRVTATGSFAVELVALALLGLTFRADAAWRRYLRLSRTLTVVAAIMLAWLFVAILAEWPPGLPERAALLTFTVWEFTTALLLARPGRSARVLLTRGRGARDGDAPEVEARPLGGSILGSDLKSSRFSRDRPRSDEGARKPVHQSGSVV